MVKKPIIRRKELPVKHWYSRTYYPMAVARTKKEAETHAKGFMEQGDRVRIDPWPKDISTEEYGEGPGGWNAPEWVIYVAKREKKKRGTIERIIIPKEWKER